MASVTWFAFAVAFVLGVAFGIPIETESPEREKESTGGKSCAKEFIEWCKGRSSTSQTSSTVSIGSFWDGSTESCELRCVVNKRGTGCEKNGSPWFHCFPNGTVSYKGKMLSSDSPDDEEVCKTKDKAVDMFSDHGIVFTSGGNAKFNRTQFEEGMKEFNREMKQFQDEMEEIGEKIGGMFRWRRGAEK